MRKLSTSRTESRNEKLDFDSFWKNDASKPLFNDDSLYRKIDKERRLKEEQKLQELSKALTDF